MLPIYLYGQPVLRKIAEEITPDYPNLKELIEAMWQSMYESDGIGLAAPQIGKPIRLLVIDANPMGASFPECKGFKTVMINAKITQESEEFCTEEEGCLSLPGIHESVSRPQSISIEYFDENFKHQKKSFSGFAARVIQHEYDHLEGMLFTDHISPFRKRLIKKKLSNIENGNVRPHYPIAPNNPKRKLH